MESGEIGIGAGASPQDELLESSTRKDKGDRNPADFEDDVQSQKIETEKNDEELNQIAYFLEHGLEPLSKDCQSEIKKANDRMSELLQKENLSDEEKGELTHLSTDLDSLESKLAIFENMRYYKNRLKSLRSGFEGRKDGKTPGEKAEAENIEKLIAQNEANLIAAYKKLIPDQTEPEDNKLALKKEDKLAPINNLDEHLVKQDGDLAVPDKKEPLAEIDEHGLVKYKEPGKLAKMEEPGKLVKPEQEPEKPQKPEVIRLVDISSVVRAMGWRMAENKLNSILNMNPDSAPGRGGIFRFFRSQYAKAGEAGYRRWFYDQAVKEITNNQDLMREIQARLRGTDLNSETRGSKDKTEQWQILDEVIKLVEEDALEADEKGENLEGAGNIFAELFKRHAMGEFKDRETFEMAAKEAIEKAIADGDIQREQFTTDKSRKGDAEGLMYASNLYEIADKYKRSIEEKFEKGGEWADLSPEQKESMMKAVEGLSNLDIQLANKLQDVNEQRPERPDQRGTYLRWSDRLSNAARQRPILGLIINPTTLGLAGGTLSRGLTRNLLIGTAAAGGIVAGGVLSLPLLIGAGLGGVFGLIHKRKNLAQDRGLEQRREALGDKGRGKRAEKLREYGFSTFSADARELIDKINTGDLDALNQAAALFEAESELRHSGRPVDLIRVGTKESDEFHTNLISKSELRILVKRHQKDIDLEAVKSQKADIGKFVQNQDKKFEKYRNYEGAKAGALGFATGIVMGVAAQEFSHWFKEAILHKDLAGEVTLLGYLRGQRPNVAHFEGVGEQILPGATKVVEHTFPKTGQTVEIKYIFDKNGHVTIDQDFIKHQGFSIDQKTGEIISTIPGVKGSEVSPENWASVRESWLAGHHEKFAADHVGWRNFMDNRTPSIGSSWNEAYYLSNADKTELMMNYHQGNNGSVIVDVSRMLGHEATSTSGRHLKINTEMLDHLVATISPRDRVLQHEALVARFQDGKLEVPKDLADKIFDVVNGRIHLKPGIQLVTNQVLGQNSEHHSTILNSLAADYRAGKIPFSHLPNGGSPGTEPITDHLKPDTFEFHPEKYLVAPIPIPISKRDPIGDPYREKTSEDQKNNKKPQNDQQENAKLVDKGSSENDKAKSESGIDRSGEKNLDENAFKIKTEKWSERISVNEYENLRSITSEAIKIKNFEKQKRYFINFIVENESFNKDIRNSTKEIPIAVSSKDHEVIYASVYEIEKCHQKAFVVFLKKLREMFKIFADMSNDSEDNSSGSHESDFVETPIESTKPTIKRFEPIVVKEEPVIKAEEPKIVEARPAIVHTEPIIKSDEPSIRRFDPNENNGHEVKIGEVDGLKFEYIKQARGGDCALVNYLNMSSFFHDGKLPMSVKDARQKAVNLRQQRRAQNPNDYKLRPEEIKGNDVPIDNEDAVFLFKDIFGGAPKQEDIESIDQTASPTEVKNRISQLIDKIDSYKSKTCTVNLGSHSMTISEADGSYLLFDPFNPNFVELMTRPEIEDFIDLNMSEGNMFLYLRSPED